MKIEMKTVYIAEDGTKFDTFEKCEEYESENIISSIECKIAELTERRNYEVSLKNRYKANKYGKLAMTEAALQKEYKFIKEMVKVPIEKMSSENIHNLAMSIASVKRFRLQRTQQKDVLDDLRHSIKEKGEQIKDLYEKLVKLKLEKLNS